MTTTHEFSQKKLALIALIPLGFLFISLGFSIIVLEQSPHLPLLLSAGVAAVVAITILKFKWEKIQEGILDSIYVTLSSVLILMIIGMLVASWIIAGVVPGLIYYGLDIISPKFFLVTALVLSSIIAIATGSSWTAAGTVGIALMGIANGLDINLGLAAGAVVSGAYFGDKLSPLSDTTNLAPAVSGADIFKHIKSMLYSTIPSYIITFIIFLSIGLFTDSAVAVESSTIDFYKLVIGASYNIGWYIFIPPVLVILFVLFKVPSLPALFSASIIGLIMAGALNGFSVSDLMTVSLDGVSQDSATVLVDELGYTYHEDIVYEDSNGAIITDENQIYNSLGRVNDDITVVDNSTYTLNNTTYTQDNVSEVDGLLTSGGISGMWWTISLIICAMAFGGVMEITGLLNAVVSMILKLVFNYTSLVTATILTSIFVNVIAADQYLSIALPGKMYKDVYTRKYNVVPENLSRVLETGGTLTSPLVPWNTCGATMSGFLGVSTLTYLPFAFFNLINPVVEIIVSGFGFGVKQAVDNVNNK